METLPSKQRWLSLLLPVTVGTVLFAVSPIYSTETWATLATIPVAALWMVLVIALPAAVMVALVRTRLFWVVGVAAFTVVSAIAPVITVRSDDAQAGLAMLMIPQVGGLAALTLGLLEAGARRIERTRP